MDKDLFTCTCGDIAHQFVVQYDPDPDWNDCIYFHVHLNNLPFWQRVRYALLYILGRRSKYGAFEEIIMDKQKANEFVGLLLKHYHKMPSVPQSKLDHSDLTLDSTVL